MRTLKISLIALIIFFSSQNIQAQGTASTIGTIAMSGLNIYSDVANLNNLYERNNKRKSGVLGIASGILQISFGAILYSSDRYSYNYNFDPRNLLVANAIVGSSSIITSIINLSLNTPNRPFKKNYARFYIYPINERLVVGITMKHNF